MSLEKVARKAKTTTKSAEEWDAMKMVIHDLYIIQDLSLPEVIKIMENENSFSQSYVIPFCSWRCAGLPNLQLSQAQTVYYEAQRMGI